MTATSSHYHIFAAEVVCPPQDTPRDLALSVAILTELMQSSEAYLAAKAAGNLASSPSDSGLALVFTGEGSVPMLCVLNLVGILDELPMIAVRIALHSGSLGGDVKGPEEVLRAAAPEIDGVRVLLQSGRAGQILVSREFTANVSGIDLMPAPLSHLRAESRLLLVLESEAGASKVGDELTAALESDGHDVTREEIGGQDLTWAKTIEARIRSADAIVAIVTEQSARSELLQYQLEIAVDERRSRGRPQIIPVWLNTEPVQEARLTALRQNSRQVVWRGPDDTDRVIEEVRGVIVGGQEETDADRLDSPTEATTELYLRRPVNREFEEALADHESIVLVKGPRQIGKSTLMTRGVQLVDEQGWRCATTDFQRLSSRQMNTETSFYRVLASTLCRQVGFDFDLDNDWLEGVSPTLNMDSFMRQLLKSSDRPLVWFMDEADRLFSAPFACDFYGLVRSWYNARATDWRGPWERLTVVIAYATEVHLFVKDVNLSPFNVGHRIEIPMLSLEDTVELNQRIGSPISNPEMVGSLHSQLGGQPFLTRRALELVSSGRMSGEELLRDADRDDGPFGDHLKRILVSVTQLASVREALAQSLSSVEIPDSEGLRRLISSGILVRSGGGYKLVCELYGRYLARYRQGGI